MQPALAIGHPIGSMVDSGSFIFCGWTSPAQMIMLGHFSPSRKCNFQGFLRAALTCLMLLHRTPLRLFTRVASEASGASLFLHGVIQFSRVVSLCVCVCVCIPVYTLYILCVYSGHGCMFLLLHVHTFNVCVCPHPVSRVLLNGF